MKDRTYARNVLFLKGVYSIDSNDVHGCFGCIWNYKPLEFPDNDFRVDITFNYRTPNIDHLHETLTARGIKVTDLIESFDKQFRCFSFKDIDGNNISVVSG